MYMLCVCGCVSRVLTTYAGDGLQIMRKQGTRVEPSLHTTRHRHSSLQTFFGRCTAAFLAQHTYMIIVFDFISSLHTPHTHNARRQTNRHRHTFSVAALRLSSHNIRITLAFANMRGYRHIHSSPEGRCPRPFVGELLPKVTSDVMDFLKFQQSILIPALCAHVPVVGCLKAATHVLATCSAGQQAVRPPTLRSKG